MLEKSQDSGLEGERGQVGGLFIPSFNAPHLSPSLPLVKPTPLSYFFFSFPFSLFNPLLCSSPAVITSHILRAPSVSQVLATALDTV